MKIGVHYPGTYRIILDTDAKEFGGFGRLNPSTELETVMQAEKLHLWFTYIPARAAFILTRKV